MTWVVGGNCFNGFVCVADIQATIIKSNGQTHYYNCVQKIHKVTDNLCVAFSGDIRSGFKIVDFLRENIAYNFKEGEYFDIDGQSQNLINILKYAYNDANPKNKPNVELMFLWNSQEGDGYLYRPFCMKFKSPNFTMNSTAMPGLAQSGSGMNNSTFQAIISFLQGKKLSTIEYNRLFSKVDVAPSIITLKNFKNILLNEASKVSQPGISKSLISFESEIPYKDIFDKQQSRSLKEVFITLGVSPTKMETLNYNSFITMISKSDIQRRLTDIENNNLFLFNSIKTMLSKAKESINIQPIIELPPIVFDQHVSSEEEIHSSQLISTWPKLKQFLGTKGICVSAIQAIA